MDPPVDESQLNQGPEEPTKPTGTSQLLDSSGPTKPDPAVCSTRIFIVGISTNIASGDLKEYFNNLCEEFGCKGRVAKVTQAASKGFGFATFDNMDAIGMVLQAR